MSGNLENLGPLRLQILGQGDATLIAERDTMNAARIHLTDYRKRERNPDRLHLARAIGEVPAMLAALRKAQDLLRELEAPAHLEEGADIDDTISAILARIDQGE